MKEVVVTGVGSITPLGAGASTLYERWAAGEVGIRDGEAPCADFDPLEFFSRKEARRADRFTQFALAAAQEALGQAGWADESPYDPARTGCILGTGIGGLGTLEANLNVLRDEGPEKVAPLAVPLMMGNAGSAAIAMRHDLRGPVFGVVSACAAGANAIAAATRTIQCGDADAVVTGGSEAGLTALARAAFAALDATSTSGVCRPFDVRRDGFIMGEGAGVLVLEDGDRARRWPELGRTPPDRASRRRLRRRRRDDGRAARRRPRAGGRGLRERARNLDAAERPFRDDGDQGRAGRACR
jgi:3-oxoacyl-[acyl-carrier-protein] synthase II